jgi:hypothetical protein
MMTFFAPAARCFAAPSRPVKIPVDSKTTSTPSDCHGSSAGSLIERTWNESWLTRILSPLAEISPCRFPRMESYLSRWARVAAFVQIVHGDEIDAAVAHSGAHDVAADTAEPVDPDFDGHLRLL